MKKFFFYGLLVPFFMLGSQNVQAQVQTKSLIYEHNGIQLEGYLATPSDLDGEHPGVMVVHQWMGLGDYEKMRARQLAKMGYVAFAADIYGADTRPETTHEASLASSTFSKNRNRYRKRVKKSLEIMKNLDSVNPEKTAAIGYCFGGTGVLELARTGAAVDAVVSFHGGLTNPSLKDAANIKSKVQVHHGAQDPHVTQNNVLSFWNEMKQYSTVDWELIVYSKATHGFTEPETDAYNKRADRLSWNSMTRLFKEVF